MDTYSAIQDWHWEITKRCNLKCLHCIMGDCSGYEMTTKEAFEVIDKIKKLGGKRLFITGGEPIMRSDLGSIIKEAHFHGLTVCLITNGTMISEFFLENISNYIENIAISIDGFQKTQDMIRGNGVYEKCISAIKLIAYHDIDVSVYTTIHALNEHFIYKFVEEMFQHGVENFHFNEISPEGRAKENKNLLLPPQKTFKRANFILSQLQKIVEIKEIKICSNCTISPRVAYLQSDGILFACVELAFNDQSQGIINILNSDIEKIKKNVNNFFNCLPCLGGMECCYTTFSFPGINIILNELKQCPFIGGIDNESKFV